MHFPTTFHGPHNHNQDEGLGSNHLGVVGLALFYVPVALLLLVNLFFYATSNRQIGKQLVYNRNMQHFQVEFRIVKIRVDTQSSNLNSGEL